MSDPISPRLNIPAVLAWTVIGAGIATALSCAESRMESPMAGLTCPPVDGAADGSRDGGGACPDAQLPDVDLA